MHDGGKQEFVFSNCLGKSCSAKQSCLIPKARVGILFRCVSVCVCGGGGGTSDSDIFLACTFRANCYSTRL